MRQDDGISTDDMFVKIKGEDGSLNCAELYGGSKCAGTTASRTCVFGAASGDLHRGLSPLLRGLPPRL
jgi:hypothetical protein